jgi:hypothetical protein
MRIAFESTRAIRVTLKKTLHAHTRLKEIHELAAVGQFGRVSRACAAARNSDAVPSDAAGNKSAILEHVATLQHVSLFFFLVAIFGVYAQV